MTSNRPPTRTAEPPSSNERPPADATGEHPGPPPAGPAEDPGLRIGDAAATVGVSARTLRYYEELGLLTPSGYTSGGERRYRQGDIDQLRRIIELKEVLGMNLEEIKGVIETDTRLGELRAAYRANKELPAAKVRERQREILREVLLLNETLASELDAKLARMDAFRARLTRDAARCRELLAELD